MKQSELREDLVRLILGGDLAYSSEQVAELGGLSVEEAQKLWRTLGFPDAGDGVAYGDFDVEAMRVVAEMLRNGDLDERTVMRMTRALGNTMSRLADWQVSTLVGQVESDVEDGKSDSRIGAAIKLGHASGPNFEQFMIYAWRRHLAAAAARVEALGAADEELLSTSMSVGFADLSRFTSLSNGLDEDALGELVENFENRCTDIVTAHGGRVIKTMGDAILFVVDEPNEATLTALDLVKQIGSRDDLPDIRVGLATGSVISRLGDVFGPPVNLAARLSHVARSNRVLVDATTAAVLDDEFDKRVLPPRLLRGFGEVSPVTVSVRRGFRPR